MNSIYKKSKHNLYPVSEEEENMLLFRTGTFESPDAKVVVGSKAIPEDPEEEREVSQLKLKND